MIDVNLNELRIMPADHIAFKDSDFIEATQNENSLMKSVLIVLFLVGSIAITLNLKKEYEKSRKK